MRVASDKLLNWVDVSGTFLFGVEAAMYGINAQLDVFGILAISFVTALGGGMIRDVLLGAAAPAALKDPSYPVAALLGGVAPMLFYSGIREIPENLIMVLDAAGLGLFATAGTAKALDYKMHPVVCAILATITGCGGGTIRDLFLDTIPRVLRADLYAVAALVGAVTMLICVGLKLHRATAMTIGAVACFAFRVLSVWQHWQLPKISH